MRPERVAAERAKEVRDAAKAWQRAGFATGAVVDQVNARYPDDRQRFGPGFRIVAFVFAWMAAWSCMGFFFIPLAFVGSDGWGFLMIFWGALLTAATEYQTGPLKRSDAGAESATGLMAVGFLLAGFVALAEPGSDRTGRDLLLVIPTCGALLAAAAAYRWAERLYFVVALGCLYVLLAQAPFGRAGWILLSLLVIPGSLAAARNEERAPSHRRGAMVVAIGALWALYFAVHVWSVDEHLIEELNLFTASASAIALTQSFRAASILATGLMPLIVLAVGWRLRESLLVSQGLLLLGASVASIRLYHSLLPLWLGLIVIGGACLGLALGLRRWLRAGETGERNGFTADPLLDDLNRTEVIRTALAAAVFTPAPRTMPPGSAFEGRGGAFGGGGATSSF